MDSVESAVFYCCVSKGGEVLYSYNGGGGGGGGGGDREIEKLAALCLELTPPYHRWYFQTMLKKTFGFLMYDGYVYFAIVKESVGNSEILRFLHKLRDEFRRVGTTSVSALNSLCWQEQLLPVVRSLVASLEHHVSRTTSTGWPGENASSYQGELTPSPCSNANGHVDGGASTKAPLLGKPSKQEKKKRMKDHVIGIEMEEHRRSSDRKLKIDSGELDSDNQATLASPLRKDFNGTARIKMSSQSLRKKWCRQVRIVLAVDALVCVVLFVIWLVICHGMECIR